MGAIFILNHWLHIQQLFRNFKTAWGVCCIFCYQAVLSQTPISSHDVFSFQKTKRKTALAHAGKYEM